MTLEELRMTQCGWEYSDACTMDLYRRLKSGEWPTAMSTEELLESRQRVGELIRRAEQLSLNRSEAMLTLDDIWTYLRAIWGTEPRRRESAEEAGVLFNWELVQIYLYIMLLGFRVVTRVPVISYERVGEVVRYLTAAPV